jgi:hypothetical protein
MAKLDQKIGRVTGSFGEVIEHLIMPNVLAKFRALGFTFNEIYRNHQIQRNDGTTAAEIDAEFHNGEAIMIVEVKAHPDTDDVGRLLKKMSVLREFNKFPDKKLYGALAAAVIGNDVRDKAIGSGFYVLEQSGDTMQILPADKDFRPKEW